MFEIQPPYKDPEYQNIYQRIFLAGSIEMGKAPEWQRYVIDQLKDINNHTIIYNPRRKDWNNDCSKEILNEQIYWELKNLNRSDIILFNFSANTISPISLFELGAFGLSHYNKEVYVVADEDYLRITNLEISCEFFNIKRLNSLDEFIKIIKNYEHKKLHSPCFNVWNSMLL